jgi:outer membrane protein OmpA-like peptidoglycan-associated protein
MKKISVLVLGVVLLLTFVLVGGFAFAQQDVKGSKDYPLFTRFPNTYIMDYKEREFDKFEFYADQSRNRKSIEGHYFYLRYGPTKDARRPTCLEIIRNFQNAIKRIGGTVLYSNDDDITHLKISREGREVWIAVQASGGTSGEYFFNIVEQQAMEQQIVADAKFMSEGITSTGHVAIYGIYFDFNKSDVKPESEPALSEIAKLLTGNPNLKVFIVGHTDNVGGIDYNMKLSQARADAVVKALTTKYKVNLQQMKAYGAGQLAPVAPNKTEEGRAKNRRVELVEQ